jgi:C4-dicarboxylate transporter
LIIMLWHVSRKTISRVHPIVVRA